MRTISGTPPTAVATTGTPAASDSTAACGKFSRRARDHARVCSREHLERLGAGERAAKDDAVATIARGRALLEAEPVGPVTDDHKPCLRDPGDSGDREIEVLLAREPPDEGKRAW